MYNKTKKLGQNFLINNDIAEREIDYCSISKKDIILEIGPGKGIITKKLVEKAKIVISIEIDKNLYNYLKNIIKSKNLILINDDALKFNFNKIPKFNKIVSNLPYQISSPLTIKLLDYFFDKAVLIYQKEFANRMVARIGNKDYSRLSILIYYKTNCRILENIYKENFKPKPKVDSSIVELIPRKKPPFIIYNEHFFFDFTKNMFVHKRKKIKNNLKNFYNIKINNIPYLDNRIDELEPEKIGHLSNIVYEELKNIT